MVDVSTLSKPKVEREVYLPGNYATSRRIEEVIRVVSSSNGTTYPAGVQTGPSSYDRWGSMEENKKKWLAELPTVVARNEAIIRNATLEHWLPVAQTRLADGTLRVEPRDCSSFLRNQGTTQLGVVTVATVNLSNPLTLAQTHVIGQVSEVYASKKNLYLSNHHWFTRSENGQTNATYLHQFDLSNPTQPRKMGELKIPGFSTYLHPLDEHHLLTIGTGMSVNRSVQLSLFDVSDMANPIQKFTHNLVAPYATSEAQGEHRAFNYFPEKKVLAFPYSDWNARPPSDTSGKSSFVSELRVLSVDTQTGFAPKGAMSMADLFKSDESPNGSVRHSPLVRRSILADDFVYVITDAGIRMAPLSNLSDPVATVSFDALN